MWIKITFLVGKTTRDKLLFIVFTMRETITVRLPQSLMKIFLAERVEQELRLKRGMR